MRLYFAFMALTLIHAITLAQELSQTVRGTISDIDTESPLYGATVVIVGSDPLIGAVADEEGKFRIDQVPVGRVSLSISYLGYESKSVADIMVSSGKEVVLELRLQESILDMKAVIIKANKNQNKGEALNEMAILSAQSISPEQSKRYAGGFNDPSRILSNVAGVTNSQNGENDIIVRGNSPKYIQWRLEGMEITNPTHFADQNAVKGGISALNNDLLTTSDFYTGAFSAEYGNVLSGVYDVKLRAGNNENFEAAFGFGLLGTDLTLEGPFKKGYGGSFLINYRYSAIGLASDLGLIAIDGILTYQDMAFKVVLPTKRFGVFSAFGLGGLSGFDIEDVNPQFQSTPGQASGIDQVTEDYLKDNFLINSGLSHTITLNGQSYLKTLLSYSSTGLDEDIFQRTNLGEARFQSFEGNLRRSTYSASVNYSNKISKRNRLLVGSKYSLIDYRLNQYQGTNADQELRNLTDFKEDIDYWQNYVTLRHRLNQDMTLVLGVHNMNVLFNNKHTLESRVAWRWKVNTNGTVSAGYGEHSSMESVPNYFAKVESESGNIEEPNRDLDLLRARHFIIGYERRLSENLMAKAEVYYQHLYDLPVENVDSSFYSTINEGNEFRYTDLVNEGEGKNYGVELTLECFFNKDYYFLLNGSAYQSKYTPLDGKERNTLYNGNYLLNALIGREVSGLGKKKNRTLALNAKFFYAGGQKHVPLLRDPSGALAVDPDAGLFRDFDKAYENSLEDVFQVDFTASYTIDKKKATHEIFLSFVNLTNSMANLSEYYDESEEGSVGHITQFGTFPNLMYRVYF